uniref:GH18 domain-containing protein n=1 Tax=Chromera velia CCMP2878 TaxID=1169474 RepID=A0A0G4IBN1_9ALVE|eukprot:Cvel_2207.t1-p1 / transcript=Cvel_2207.t1 / gene=Cvel_2207 / organism=Chromera_velia_CCMP2878 / gene_product=Chitinase 1, putative / transcript_product=Chitinase 1, putative / location=Cvel_scaffold85:54386-55606(+) / protein_length=407 / sequence_SO=supercontig / SO=protein_coding / is_pseudo=false
MKSLSTVATLATLASLVNGAPLLRRLFAASNVASVTFNEPTVPEVVSLNGTNSTSLEDFVFISKEALQIGKVPEKVVGTYMGAWPNGVAPQPLSDLPKEVNTIMISFATDGSADKMGKGHGTFEARWDHNVFTKEKIAADKQANPDRVYLISVGGSADAGGTFFTKVSNEEWINNAFDWLEGQITELGADGAEMQFEGVPTYNPGLENFKTCMEGLLARLKAAGYITAVGPFYGRWGTSQQYKLLDLTNVDLVNMQMYANGRTSASDVVSDGKAAIAELQGSGNAGKFVFGANSAGRMSADVALESFEQLLSEESIRGLFTWDIEHSGQGGCNPKYCLETTAADILGGSEYKEGSCDCPGQISPPHEEHTGCGMSWADAQNHCGNPLCTVDADCPGDMKCFGGLTTC